MRVLVVEEDEPRLAEGLRAGLVADGFAVDVAPPVLSRRVRLGSL